MATYAAAKEGDDIESLTTRKACRQEKTTTTHTMYNVICITILYTYLFVMFVLTWLVFTNQIMLCKSIGVHDMK